MKNCVGLVGNGDYKVGIIIKESAFSVKELHNHYTSKIPVNSVGFAVAYNANNKAPVALIKQQALAVLTAADKLGIKLLLVADTAYFKHLAKQTKTEFCHGYIYKCAVANYGHIQIALIPNYQAIFHNPLIQSKIDMGIKTTNNFFNGNKVTMGTNIIHQAEYPVEIIDIHHWLNKLETKEVITCDVETTSLHLARAKLKTIAFSWSKHEGVAFTIDNLAIGPKSRFMAKETKRLLKSFFHRYTGKIIYHNASYDITVLIRNLFMEDFMDYEGALKGLDVLTRNIEDTKIIAYLATNTTAGNSLKLKSLAHEFAGDYGITFSPGLTVPESILLKYNLIDCLATYYVYEKYKPLMIKDGQEDVYNNIFMPSLKNIINMQLVGLPMKNSVIDDVECELNSIYFRYSNTLKDSDIVQDYTWQMQKDAFVVKNMALKTKVISISEFKCEFNPGSGKQTQGLLYDTLKLPIINKTEAGQPSTDKATLKALKAHVENSPEKFPYRDSKEKIIILIDALIELNNVSKLLNTFLPAFQHETVYSGEDTTYLFGNFNLGGTKSGRMSSSKINLQNLPSTGNKYAKLIKGCFQAPPGWLFVGADFNSLEDMISALLTKDENKIKVYTDGYDGHCLRAYYYFRELIDNVDPNCSKSINSIAENYPKLRQDSKAPTFALTYQGTWRALQNQCGFSKEKSQSIEKNYHDLYAVSDKWVADQLEKASKTGSVELAFGLKLRTPILSQTILNKGNTPYVAAAEARTAGNALAQSYGLLTNRACIEFMDRVHKSEHRLSIKPSAQIHDAAYFMVKDDPAVIKWLNDNLIECMEWQNLPAIEHDKVKLGATLEVYKPNWATPVKIPNKSSETDISEILNNI